MTEAWVDERGVLRVPAVPHTCGSHHELQQHRCAACEEMQAFWQSFEEDRAVPVPRPQGWDEMHDAQVSAVADEDAPEVLP